MRKIAIFASGSGTNAENIIKYFSNRNNAKVTLVLSNKREAYVLLRAATLEVKSVFFDRNEFYNQRKVLDYLLENGIDFIVLAGFLWLVPNNILEEFDGRIVNIHPALLPKYGGKGMYGEKVHKAVIDNHDTESGISIHYVNRNYDEGGIIFQAKCRVDFRDTPETLASRVHALEYEHFPRVIEELINKLPEKPKK
ncbi:MAG: phosphoribosylglycinamide formyltransferase [Bacteroidales bacterium]|jgi:phosphoribosylglycinamide formyltransferase-1|nr:phosphoribosylglycinamide formyltransferase [Bacteroidales bacterium]